MSARRAKSPSTSGRLAYGSAGPRQARTWRAPTPWHPPLGALLIWCTMCGHSFKGMLIDELCDKVWNLAQQRAVQRAQKALKTKTKRQSVELHEDVVPTLADLECEITGDRAQCAPPTPCTFLPCAAGCTPHTVCATGTGMR